ncbi:MAG: hypothetical protein H7Z18_02275 [Methylophilaceae bacterium]|nr:hypothetical protein [Methylophilaceae bacterium]
MCKNEAIHALEKWHQAQTANNAAQSRTWLVAVIMTAKNSSSEIEAQAAIVLETAPEFLTVQYNLARLLRLSSEYANADNLLDAQLKKPLFQKVHLICCCKSASLLPLPC